MNKKTISLFEIYLLFTFSVAFAFIMGQTNELSGQLPVKEKESSFIGKLRKIILSYLSNGLVSAQSVPSNLAIWTCQTNVNGTACQEYPSNTCNSLCTTNCFPGTRSNFANCNLGSCFDSNIGTCSPGTPKFLCEQNGGQWSETQQSQCNRECCLINPDGQGGAGQAQFTTQVQCNYLGQTLGAPTSWVPVAGEIECLLKASSQEEGACVLEPITGELGNNCDFVTQTACITAGGDFYSGKLCTNPELNTTCERTPNTKCFPGKDEVYYIDSCENKANIYDSTKVNDPNYWSVVVPKTQSCVVSVTQSSVTNQASCGNCNYLTGSICGTPRADIDTSANNGNYVCRDLSCVDEWGDRKRNGESWCAFDGKIGLDGSGTPVPNTTPLFGDLPIASGQTWCINTNNGIATIYNSTGVASEQTINIPSNQFTQEIICSNETSVSGVIPSGVNEERSVDIPGSEHYRKICFDGEVRTEPCGGGRTGVCAQSPPNANGYTSASCRANLAMMCLAVNPGENDDPEKLNKCEENPDCFLKHVGINKFAFDMCVPKYPLGIYGANSNVASAEAICSFGSQTCTYIEKKKFRSWLMPLAGIKWDCIINCGCKTQAFAETMNNLCSSLGDCGGKINLNGEFSDDGYSTKITDEDDNPLRPGPRVSENYISGMQAYKTPVEGQSATALNGSQMNTIFGVQGLNFEANSLPETMGQLGLGAAIAVSTTALGVSLGIIGGATIEGVAVAAGPALGSFGLALQGAGIGAAIGYILVSLFGLEGNTATIVMIVSTVAFAALAYFKVISFSGPFIIVVIIIVIILMILGIGKTRERHVEFKCMPWQPPAGGTKCDLCNSGDLPCTKYKCETFGKACRYLNEGTGNEVCVNIAPNDSAPPTINVNPSAISSDFSYVGAQTNVGVQIKQDSASDGCLKEYSSVNWGILLDEPGQCKFSELHTQRFEDMELFFGANGGSNNYQVNHAMPLAMPTLGALGISGVDPNRRGQYNLYVRCRDISGNSNTAEYTAQFCVAPADDHTAPVLNNFNPVSPGFVGLEATTKIVQFYTNEPATCKWSLTSGQDYSQMTNLVQCNNELYQVTLNGWLCHANLPVGNATTTNYYFRCADQPWLGNNETNPNLPDPDQNVNSEDAPNPPYQLKRTTTALSISSVSPSGTMYVGSAPHEVDIEINTAGGINNGDALCSFRASEGNYIPFFSTGTNVHKQENLYLFPGNYNYQFECVDSAQNTANASTQFNIELDANGPMITRVYSTGASLNVVTNEPSTCAWSNNACSFEFVNGTLLSGSNLLHSMPYNNGITYRIKCKDSFGNIGTCMSLTGGY